jgi:cellulose synthase (UDP-forming)
VLRDRYAFNWSLAWPLIVLFIATAVSLWRNLGMWLMYTPWMTGITPANAGLFRGIGLAWIWSVYNLLLLGVSLLILVDVPKPDPYEWLDLRRVVRIDIADRTFWGVTTRMSEVGVLVTVTEVAEFPSSPHSPISVTLEIMEEKLQLAGTIANTDQSGELFTVRIAFDSLNLEQHRRLVELLYCRPGQWRHRETPGELRSLLLLFKILLKPRVLFHRHRAL